MTNSNVVSVLELALHGMTVGYLAGYRDGRNILTFAPEFVSNEARPTLVPSRIESPLVPSKGERPS